MSAVRVSVIGGGFAGLACAIGAARAGAHVQVFHQGAADVRCEAHVEVVPNMLRDLVRLGVGDLCVRAGFPYCGINVLDQAGRTLYSDLEVATDLPALSKALSRNVQ